MKKIMMTLAMAIMAITLVGCSKESKYESQLREAAKLVEEGTKGAIKLDEADVKKKVEEFKKLSNEEKDKMLKEGDEIIKKLKEELKKKK